MKYSIFVMIAMVLLSGCATIVRDDSQPVSFSSDPQGATVLIDGTKKGITPTTIMVKRKASKQFVRYDLVGYKSHTFTLEESISGMVLGNIIFGGVVGVIVDFVSGKGTNYQDSVHVRLTPSGQPINRVNSGNIDAPMLRKLSELKSAYDARLISANEYELSRQAILGIQKPNSSNNSSDEFKAVNSIIIKQSEAKNEPDFIPPSAALIAKDSELISGLIVGPHLDEKGELIGLIIDQVEAKFGLRNVLQSGLVIRDINRFRVSDDLLANRRMFTVGRNVLLVIDQGVYRYVGFDLD
jgi:uncharacterized protein YceK